MKRLMTMMLALSFAIGVVGVSFAQDQPQQQPEQQNGKKKKSKKKGKKKGSEQKQEGGTR
ncbi:MAG TPA: hypothetical protein VG675_02515 [Bryobacteraceae bacterium]|nr:hypothetical protein [Bryobacteraceae bacterium]